ncbi:thiol-disulfide oxidoreductase DCC family protein [Pedobacter arcticus]|uniref:thiol-disulfide oxidoreductase DCC family protein n=1 Tax=Pedobacter arcticus TaxID=752140 RepID=UPI0003075AAA|nr:DCC1-like thiol-disulfide oxidoreductase family protein [Pedobacter arcticus]
MEKHGIVLFDGVCNLCDGFVQRIIVADQKDFFRFASLQSEIGKNLLSTYPHLQDLKSIVYLENGKIFTKSNAVLKIAGHLNGLWKLVQIGYVLPAFLRNGLYNWVAQYRYQWFGKKEQCMVPTPELKAKFL